MAKTNAQRDVDKAARRDKGRYASQLSETRVVMGTPQGRAWVWRLLEVTDVNQGVAFTPNAMELSRVVGVQSVGNAVLAEIRVACPEQEIVMRQEAAHRAAREALENEAPDDDNE